MIVQSDSMFDSLPEGWQVERLANVADILFSNVDKHMIEGEVPVRLCNYVDVYKNSRITKDILFMEASADEREIERFQIAEGDVLITKDSETPDDIAIPALVAEDLPGVLCGYHLAMIRPRKHLIYGPYLAWLHNSKSFRSHYEANAVGVTRFGLSQADFKASRIPLPSLDEQRRIAAYLDKTCAAIDTAIEKKQKQLETLDALRKSIIHKAVTRGLDESAELKDSKIDFFGLTPLHWRRTKLRYEISMRSGDFVSDKLDDEGEYPVIGGNGLMGRTPAYNINGDVVVIGRVGAYCGIAHYISEKAWISDNALIVESTHNKRYFTHLFNTLDFNTEANRTAQPVITGTKIKNTYVMLPPIWEQGNISNYIDSKNAELTELQRNLNDQIATLQQYRKSLIHECVTGKRRITEDDAHA